MSRAPEAMGWTPPDGIDVPKWRCLEHHFKGGARAASYHNRARLGQRQSVRLRRRRTAPGNGEGGARRGIWQPTRTSRVRNLPGRTRTRSPVSDFSTHSISAGRGLQNCSWSQRAYVAEAGRFRRTAGPPSEVWPDRPLLPERQCSLHCSYWRLDDLSDQGGSATRCGPNPWPPRGFRDRRPRALRLIPLAGGVELRAGWIADLNRQRL
jgi:hypothetical protein